MKNSINKSGMQLLEMNHANNSSTPINHHFNIPSGDGIPILKLNKVTETITMYKILTLIGLTGVLAVIAIGYIHLLDRIS